MNVLRLCTHCLHRFAVEFRDPIGICPTCIDVIEHGNCRQCGQVVGQKLTGDPETCAVCDAAGQSLTDNNHNHNTTR